MPRSEHLLRSSILVIVIFGLNKLTGFVKLLLMTNAFGTGPAADAWAASTQLPELIFALLSGGALAAALIPVYSAYLLKQKGEESRQLAGTVLTLTVVILVGACTVVAVAAPWFARVVLVPDFAPEQQATVAELMRIVLITFVIYGISSVVSSLLNAHQHFLMPALAATFIDLGQIVGLYYLVPKIGIAGVAWGTVLGAAVALLIQLPPFIKRRIGLRPRLAMRLEGVREVGHLMGPRIVTLGAVQAVDLIFIRLASQLAPGSISAFFYAMLVMVALPRSLFGQAISTVFFPTMAEQFNQGKHVALRQTFSLSIQATLALVIPSALALVALGSPAIAFLFQRGSFDADATLLVYTLVVILALRLVSESLQDVLSLLFYARHNTQTPMWAQLGWMVANIGLSFLLVRWLGIYGLALATTLAAMLLTTLLYLLHHRQPGTLDTQILRRGVGRILVASMGMCAAIVGIRWLTLLWLGLPLLPYLAIAIFGGGMIYLILYSLLGGEEVMWIVRTLGKRE